MILEANEIQNPVMFIHAIMPLPQYIANKKKTSDAINLKFYSYVRLVMIKVHTKVQHHRIIPSMFFLYIFSNGNFLCLTTSSCKTYNTIFFKFFCYLHCQLIKLHTKFQHHRIISFMVCNYFSLMSISCIL